MEHIQQTDGEESGYADFSSARHLQSNYAGEVQNVDGEIGREIEGS